MRSSIDDVAQLAGVSIATVSRVFNKPHMVSEKTKLAVLQASKKLDYYPSFAARNFATGKSRTLGFITLTSDEHSMTYSSWDYYFGILQGINDIIQVVDTPHRYRCWFSNMTYWQEKRDDVLLQMAKGKEIDGLLLLLQWEYREEFSGVIRELNQLNVPIVVISHSIAGENLCCVKVDNHHIGWMAADLLISRGHKKIGLISGPLANLAAQERQAGFYAKAEKAKFSLNSLYCINSGFNAESGYESMMKLLKLVDPPSAVFCVNDLVASGALRALKENNILCPEQVELIGVDNNEVSKTLMPSLTTFQLPLYEVGKKATRELLKLIHNDGGAPQKNEFVFKAELIQRESTQSALSQHDQPGAAVVR